MTESGAPEAVRQAAIDKGIDHAWAWFSLHAGQRLLAVDFFLVASAFLSAAYVSALHYSAPAIALAIGLLGVWSTLCFSRFEIRVRELLRAAEDALKPLQQELSGQTGVGELKLCERVDTPSQGFTSYHKVIRALHWVIGVGFALGSLWASRVIWPDWWGVNRAGESTIVVIYRISILLSAVASLYFAYRISLLGRDSFTWVHWLLCICFAAVGIAILVIAAIRSL